MTHTRIRPFNTRDTYPEQKLDNDLCQAVVARGTLKASTQMPVADVYVVAVPTPFEKDGEHRGIVHEDRPGMPGPSTGS